MEDLFGRMSIFSAMAMMIATEGMTQRLRPIGRRSSASPSQRKRRKMERRNRKRGRR